MSELRACGVLVIRSDPKEPWRPREFLLMRHPRRWDLPKGHVDPGEDDVACALRELEEETGVPPDAVELHPHFRFVTEYHVASQRTGGESWRKTVVIFLGRLLRDVEIVTTEHEGFRWFSWQPDARIQEQTIDPLLRAVEAALARNG